MRLHSLDSLRGIAAFAVAVYHSLLVFPGLYGFLGGQGIPYAVSGDIGVLMLTATPPSLLWAGREAVLLFFVLSGFVLALPFEGTHGARPGYAGFAAKRVVRLLVPCIAVTLLLVLLIPLINPQPRPELSYWFNASWNEPITPRLVLGHALLLMDDYTLNNPMWTLHYELRISLIFPLMVLLAAWGSHVLLAATALAGFICIVELSITGTHALETFLLVPYFTFGLLLARHRQTLTALLTGLPVLATAALWVLCYLLLTFRWLVATNPLFCDLANGLGATLLIGLVLSSPRARRVLEVRWLTQLGAVSYSLYLVHVPVLLAMLHLAPPEVSPVLLAALAPLVSVLFAFVLWRLVERPSIGLGRQAGDWFEARRRRHGRFGQRQTGSP